MLRYCPDIMIGAKLTHSQAGRPQGRGKIERFFRTVRDQFLVEIADRAGTADRDAGGEPGRPELTVRRLAPSGLPPAGPLRDGADSAATVPGPRRAGPGPRRHPDRGVPVERVADRDLHRPGEPARQSLRRRPVPGREPGSNWSSTRPTWTTSTCAFIPRPTGKPFPAQPAPPRPPQSRRRTRARHRSRQESTTCA